MNTMQQASRLSNALSGPNVFFGYCRHSRRYRMMHLGDYMSNMNEGVSRLMNDGAHAYNEALGLDARGTVRDRTNRCGDCCGDRCADSCHCECCVCDADILVHGRCGETRRIPITFENPTRREKPVTLDFGEFVSAGGRDVDWPAQLSATEFTLRPCGEHTVFLTLQIRCARDAVQPGSDSASKKRSKTAAASTAGAIGSVDRCEVGYATIRAEGCLTRPIVVAVAVLPDDCDDYRHPCGCSCCH